MTLRFHLVVALVGLVAAGLAAFGATTYTLYDRSQYQRLDAQIRSSAPLVDQQLDAAALGGPSNAPPAGLPVGGGRGSPPPVFVPPGTYAELRAVPSAGSPTPSID